MSLRQGSSKLSIALIGILLVVTVGCSKASAPPPPKKVGLTGGNAQNNPDLGQAGATKGDADGDVKDGEPNLAIKLKSGGSTIKGESGESLKEEFEITGATSASDVYLALSSRPDGLRISGRNSLTPTLSWLNPKTGSYKIKFILRDARACKEAEGSAEACDFDSEDDGKISADKSYDRESSTFTIDVEPGSGSGSDLNNNNNGGGGDNKSQLIQKIMGLLLSGGGGLLGGLGGGLGGGGGGDLGGLLGGLNTGQLQNLLGGLQGGGGGLDFQNILGGLLGGGGFGLTSAEVCQDIEEYLAEGAGFSTYEELEAYVYDCGLDVE